MSPASPSSQPGMGSIPCSGGVAFRVWAPFAAQVHVAGQFNDWAKAAHPLASEGNGYWSTDVQGAKVGQQYLYVIRRDGEELWRIDPYAKDVTDSTYQNHKARNAIICDGAFDWGTKPYQAPLWHEMVIYEMHIGTFHDVSGGPPGSFGSAIAYLPYLADLGINAIQLLPTTEFEGAFSWGYNPGNLFAIESAYGGPKAFKAFVRAAHEHGIAVLFDVVYNHLGPQDVAVWRFDGWCENDKSGVYFYNDWRSHTKWTAEGRPDYGRPEVRQYLRDNALMWLTEYRVDGLRWDATAYIRNVYGRNDDPEHDLPNGWGLMQWINEEVNDRQPWKICIAEDLYNNPWITKPKGAGGANADTQWDARFVHTVRDAILTPHDEARNMEAVRDAIYHRYNGDAFQRVIYTESHDEVARDKGKMRVPTEICPGDPGSWWSKKRSTLGAVLVFTAPGIPMIFQGQEFLEDDAFHDKDPLDWPNRTTYAGIVSLHRDLIRLRRNWYDTTRGLRGQHVHVHHVNQQGAERVIAFHRWEQGGPRDDVVVVANMSHRGYESYNIGFPREGLWKVRFNSDWDGYDGAFGGHPSYDTVASWGPKDNMDFNANVSVGPYSAVIYSQD